MICKLFTLAALLAAGPLAATAQDAAQPAPPPPAATNSAVPECRDLPAGSTPAGTRCKFQGTTVPIEEYLGILTFSGGQQARIYSLPTIPGVPIAPAVRNAHPIEIAALLTVQTETFAFNPDVSQGIKISAHRQWNDWLGLDLRGSLIRFNWFSIGTYPGVDHTYAIAVGPRFQRRVGAITPYGEALIGFGHQYYYMMSTGAAAGVDVRLYKRLQWVAADAEYRWAAFQTSTAEVNPRRGRIELSTGVEYHFGS